MRKNITTIILAGFFASIAICSQAQSSNDDSYNPPIKLIKGTISYSGNGKLDLVTFGLRGCNSYMVTRVEVLDMDSQPLCEFDNPFSYLTEAGVSWFSIDLNDIKIKDNFYLRIHIVNTNGSNSDSTDGILTSFLPIRKSIFPDETVVIIKYP